MSKRDKRLTKSTTEKSDLAGRIINLKLRIAAENKEIEYHQLNKQDFTRELEGAEEAYERFK